MKKLAVYFLLGTAAMYGCSSQPATVDTKDEEILYELVKDWPQLSPGYVLSQPTGLGIDSRGHIFVFHRTGRKWVIPFPDSLISLNTILELDNATGKILNSWGANLFIMPHGLTVDKDDNIWVTDVALHQVFKFNRDGQMLMTLGVANEQHASAPSRHRHGLAVEQHLQRSQHPVLNSHAVEV
jgi:peptidylamidoglycolate lyase